MEQKKSKFINTDYVADDYFGVSMNVDDFGYLERNGIAQSTMKNLDRRYIVQSSFTQKIDQPLGRDNRIANIKQNE